MTSPDAGNIIAVDPGVTSGIAFFFPALRSPISQYATIEERDPRKLWSWLVRTEPTVVVLEQFIPYQRVDKFGAQTLEVCGWVKAYCHLSRCTLQLHDPQYRIAFIKPASEILKAQGVPLFPEHQKDAMAHLLRWQDDELHQSHPS